MTIHAELLEAICTVTKGQRDERPLDPPLRSPGLPVPVRPPWRDAAACVGKEELFIIDVGGDWRGMYDEARAICGACPVLAACREEVLIGRPIYGFVAGMTPSERRAARVARRVA